MGKDKFIGLILIVVIGLVITKMVMIDSIKTTTNSNYHIANDTTVYATANHYFSYSPVKYQDIKVTFSEYPVYLECNNDSIFGIVDTYSQDNFFKVIYHKPMEKDTQEVKLLVLPEDTPPLMISPEAVETAEGMDFMYRVRYANPRGEEVKIYLSQGPSWLSQEGDSIYGKVPEKATDTIFTIVISDGKDEETIEVKIKINPSIIIYGDIQVGYEVHKKIIEKIEQMHPEAVFNSGDLVQDGNDEELWDSFNLATAHLISTTAYYPALGNHDHHSHYFFNNFELPNNEQWYAVDIDDIHFIVLNTNISIKAGSQQYEWLEDDLKKTESSERFTIAVFHHPPYSIGRHREDEKGLCQTIVPLFEQYGVDAVFTGHDHCYERCWVNGIFYIVSGGGGAPLYEQSRERDYCQLYCKVHNFCRLCRDKDRLLVNVYDTSLNIIDHFDIYNR